MENSVLIVVGIIVSILGLINISGNINTIHSYNRWRIKEEDIPAYGKAVGTGTLIIGASLTTAGIISFWTEAAIAWILPLGVIVGLAFILYGQFRYNKGIF